MPGEDARFVELYERYYRKVLLYCRRRTAPDAVDDVVATTFLTAWRKINEVPPGSDALPWLYAVAYRAVGHHYRSNRRHHKLESKLSTLGITHSADTGEIILMDNESRQVVSALAKLRPADQELLRLLVWEELPISDIATVLGINEAAARKRATRAKSALATSYRRLDREITSLTVQEEGAS